MIEKKRGCYRPVTAPQLSKSTCTCLKRYYKYNNFPDQKKTSSLVLKKLSYSEYIFAITLYLNFITSAPYLQSIIKNPTFKPLKISKPPIQGIDEATSLGIFFHPEIKNYFSGGKMNLQGIESENLLINELAKISNTEITTLEFYAKINLLHFTQRRKKARRIFDKNINLYILSRIQLMKDQGLSLEQIKVLIRSMKESYIKKNMISKEVGRN